MCASQITRQIALALLWGLFSFCGCAHQYLVKLSNGNQIIADTKPKLRGTNYYFRDIYGQEDVVPQSRVVRIETGSVLKEEQKAPSPEKPKAPKKSKHWYFLWLA